MRKNGTAVLSLAKQSFLAPKCEKKEATIVKTVASLFGAATQIRTGDLILTKDVLYQLSHSSTLSQVFPLSE